MDHPNLLIYSSWFIVGLIVHVVYEKTPVLTFLYQLNCLYYLNLLFLHLYIQSCILFKHLPTCIQCTYITHDLSKSILKFKMAFSYFSRSSMHITIHQPKQLHQTITWHTCTRTTWVWKQNSNTLSERLWYKRHPGLNMYTRWHMEWTDTYMFTYINSIILKLYFCSF